MGSRWRNGNRKCRIIWDFRTVSEERTSYAEAPSRPENMESKLSRMKSSRRQEKANCSNCEEKLKPTSRLECSLRQEFVTCRRKSKGSMNVWVTACFSAKTATVFGCREKQFSFTAGTMK